MLNVRCAILSEAAYKIKKKSSAKKRNKRRPRGNSKWRKPSDWLLIRDRYITERGPCALIGRLRKREQKNNNKKEMVTGHTHRTRNIRLKNDIGVSTFISGSEVSPIGKLHVSPTVQKRREKTGPCFCVCIMNRLLPNFTLGFENARDRFTFS